jgi:hypothetical protein
VTPAAAAAAGRRGPRRGQTALRAGAGAPHPNARGRPRRRPAGNLGRHAPGREWRPTTAVAADEPPAHTKRHGFAAAGHPPALHLSRRKRSCPPRPSPGPSPAAAGAAAAAAARHARWWRGCRCRRAARPRPRRRCRALLRGGGGGAGGAARARRRLRRRREARHACVMQYMHRTHLHASAARLGRAAGCEFDTGAPAAGSRRDGWLRHRYQSGLGYAPAPSCRGWVCDLE